MTYVKIIYSFSQCAENFPEEDLMKKTPLYEKTVQSDAKIVDFHGWAMPLQYQSIVREAKQTRTSATLCDVSHMGQIRVKGPDALELLQKVATNDISRLKPGQIHYNLILSEKGGVVDDFMVYRGRDDFLCVVNASNKEKDLKIIQAHAGKTCDISDESESTALLSLQGPKAYLIMSRLCGPSLIEKLAYMSFLDASCAGIRCRISRTGYTGEDGFEIYVSAGDAEELWDAVAAAGADYELGYAGLGARDILRIEAGYCLWGNDIDERTNPFEAGLHWVVKLNAKDFIGKEEIIRIRSRQLEHVRVGFLMEERGVPRRHCRLCSQEGYKIGHVTSGTYSPHLDSFIGMGYVPPTYAQSDTSFQVDIRGRLCKAKIVDLPFVPFRHTSSKLQSSIK